MVNLTPEHKVLQMRYDVLKKDFLELFALKNDMLSQEEQVLSALYLTVVGQKQHQKYCLEVEIKMIKQRISLFQAYFNRNERPDVEAVEKKWKSSLLNTSRGSVLKPSEYPLRKLF